MALEECLYEYDSPRDLPATSPFHGLGSQSEFLYLWRNENSVIIGRNQNPWRECHVEALARDGVHLLRRGSGGGAVFQDLGNSIFSFFSPKDRYSRDRNFGVLVDACASLGFSGDLAVRVKGRNDLEVAGRKVSGSAFKLGSRRALHHGTLLLHTDLSRLGAYLHPNKLKLQSKGIASAQARVVNMRQALADAGRAGEAAALTHDAVCAVVAGRFAAAHAGEAAALRAVPERWGEAQFLQFPQFEERLARLQDWGWRFGESPAFQYQLEQRFEWGTVDLNLNCEGGRIVDVAVYSDSLFPQMIDLIMVSLKGVPYTAAAISEALSGTCSNSAENEVFRPHLDEFISWFISKI